MSSDPGVAEQVAHHAIEPCLVADHLGVGQFQARDQPTRCRLSSKQIPALADHTSQIDRVCRARPGPGVQPGEGEQVINCALQPRNFGQGCGGGAPPGAIVARTASGRRLQGGTHRGQRRA